MYKEGLACERWRLNEWKNMFKQIYEIKNLPISPDDILHRLVEETAELVKPTLTFDLEGLRWQLSDVFAWICAFGDKLNVDLDQLMYRKYGEYTPGKQRILPPYGIISKDRPENLQDWQKYLAHVYQEENLNIPPGGMLSRLMEDIGEASRRIRQRKEPEEVLEKLAGVFGWTIALANKFKIRLDHATWGKYPNMCWKCHTKPCKCSRLGSVFISYSIETKDEEEMVKNLLRELNLQVKAFEELGRAFKRTRMVEAFNAINESDGAIILFGTKWSMNVYAEMIEILRVLDEENVWICARAVPSAERELKVSELLSDLEQFHMITYYPDNTKLMEMLRNSLVERLQEIKERSAS